MIKLEVHSKLISNNKKYLVIGFGMLIAPNFIINVNVISLCKNATMQKKKEKFLAKFSFDILGINAEYLKVNKCSHINRSEQMSI